MATTDATPEAERIAARLTRDKKALIERAARMRGASISDFVIGAACEAARAAIEDEQILRLSLAESERFMAALTAAPRRIDALREANARRRDLVAAGP